MKRTQGQRRLSAAACGRRRAGSAAIVGVAVIALVGLIGASLLSSALVSNTAQATRSLAVQSYYIAEAGVEWASKHASETAEPIAFGGGQFEIVESGVVWNSVATTGDARCTMECNVSPNPPPSTATGDGGLEYILRSRYYGTSYNVEFRFMNTSNSSVSFDGLKVTWDSPTAYFEQINARVYNDNNYGWVWKYNQDSPQYRWGSGDQKSFNRNSGSTVTVPAHYTCELRLQEFYWNRSGWAGWGLDMLNTEVDIEFYMGSEKVGELTVGLPPVWW